MDALPHGGVCVALVVVRLCVGGHGQESLGCPLEVVPVGCVPDVGRLHPGRRVGGVRDGRDVRVDRRLSRAPVPGGFGISVSVVHGAVDRVPRPCHALALAWALVVRCRGLLAVVFVCEFGFGFLRGPPHEFFISRPRFFVAGEVFGREPGEGAHHALVGLPRADSSVVRVVELVHADARHPLEPEFVGGRDESRPSFPPRDGGCLGDVPQVRERVAEAVLPRVHGPREGAVQHAGVVPDGDVVHDEGPGHAEQREALLFPVPHSFDELFGRRALGPRVIFWPCGSGARLSMASAHLSLLLPWPRK